MFGAFWDIIWFIKGVIHAINKMIIIYMFQTCITLFLLWNTKGDVGLNVHAALLWFHMILWFSIAFCSVWFDRIGLFWFHSSVQNDVSNPNVSGGRVEVEMQSKYFKYCTTNNQQCWVDYLAIIVHYWIQITW